MLLTKILRGFSLILVSLLGLLILAGIFVWIAVLSELLNPTQIISPENKYLTPGIFTGMYYIVAVIEVLALGALTRFRWVPYKRGRLSVWLLSVLGLSQVLFYFWILNSMSGGGFDLSGGFWALIWLLILMSPFGLACFWVRERKTIQP